MVIFVRSRKKNKNRDSLSYWVVLSSTFCFGALRKKLLLRFCVCTLQLKKNVWLLVLETRLFVMGWFGYMCLGGGGG